MYFESLRKKSDTTETELIIGCKPRGEAYWMTHDDYLIKHLDNLVLIATGA